MRFPFEGREKQRQEFRAGGKPGDSQEDASAPPGLFTAMKEQLGLKLQPTKAATDVFLIDRVEQPSEN